MRHLYTGQEKRYDINLIAGISVLLVQSHIYLQVLLAYALSVAQINFLVYVGWHIATRKEIEKCVWTIDDICICSHQISRVLTFLSIWGCYSACFRVAANTPGTVRLGGKLYISIGKMTSFSPLRLSCGNGQNIYLPFGDYQIPRIKLVILGMVEGIGCTTY